MRIVRTEQAPAPVAGAPYSQAVTAAPGELVWVSGQVPVDPATGALGADDVGAQTALCLRHVAAVLAAAGAGLGDVVKTTVYLTDLAGDFAAMNAAYAEAFGPHAPARRLGQRDAVDPGHLQGVDAERAAARHRVVAPAAQRARRRAADADAQAGFSRHPSASPPTGRG